MPSSSAPPAPTGSDASHDAPADPPTDAAAGEAPLPGVHPPRQARSRATFRSLVAAARELMAEGGMDAVTVQEVVRRADVGVGSFYARFDGRDALVRYLHHELWSDAGRWWRRYLEPERWEDVPLPVVVGEVTRVLVRSHFAREVELRAFWIESLTRPADRIMERTAESDAAVVEGLARLVDRRSDAVGHPRPERAARLGAFQLLTTLRGHLLFPDSLSVEGGYSLRELVLELARALLAYLEAPPPPRSYADLLAASPRFGPGS